MKVDKRLNPESLTLNLPNLNEHSNHQVYELSKKQRKQLQLKRRELEETVMLMRRQAHETQKQFNSTQGQLMTTYQKKKETLDREKSKEEFLSMKKKNLEERRNLSNLSRYLHQVKKQQNMNRLYQKRKEQHNRIRSEIKLAEQEKRREKVNEIRELKERKKEMNETINSGIRWARDRSFREKSKQSKKVRNDLISIESERKNNEEKTIEMLEREKEEINQFIEKTKSKETSAAKMKKEIQQMGLKEFDSRVKKSQRSGEKSIVSQAGKISEVKKIPKYYYSK